MGNRGRNALFFCKKVLTHTYNRRIIIDVRRERNENIRPYQAIRKQRLEVQAARCRP